MTEIPIEDLQANVRLYFGKTLDLKTCMMMTTHIARNKKPQKGDVVIPSDFNLWAGQINDVRRLFPKGAFVVARVIHYDTQSADRKKGIKYGLVLNPAPEDVSEDQPTDKRTTLYVDSVPVAWFRDLAEAKEIVHHFGKSESVLWEGGDMELRHHQSGQIWDWYNEEWNLRTPDT